MLKNKPIRIQRSRQHKQVSPNGLPIVYVGRPSVWGNPFKLFHNHTGRYRLNQLAKYEKLIRGFVTPDMQPEATEWNKNFKDKMNQHPYEAIRSILKGKNLSCFCSLNEPCHADVLLEIAN